MSDLPPVPPPAPPAQPPAPPAASCTPPTFEYWYAWIDQAAAAAYLGIAPQSLANMRWRGDGPPYQKVRGKGAIRYTRWQLHRWMMDELADLEAVP